MAVTLEQQIVDIRAELTRVGAQLNAEQVPQIEQSRLLAPRYVELAELRKQQTLQLQLELQRRPSGRRQAPEEIRRFWAALLDSKVIADEFCTLPDNSCFLGDLTRGRELLVRCCYRGLFDRIRYLHQENVNTRFLITGTPGIGKTCFQFPLMFWLVKEMLASKIVLEVQGQRYLFSNTSGGPGVEDGTINDFEQELRNKDVWWIVDMGTPVGRPASTVLLASPDRNRYKEFLKLLGSTTLYMPVWTDDEIEKCRQRLFSNLDSAAVQGLQSKWGKIPRYVLEKAVDVPAQTSLEDAISKCSWRDLLACIGEPDSAPHASHNLLHIDVIGEDFNKKAVVLASSYVARKLEQKAGNGHVHRLRKLVHLSMGAPAYAAVAGAFFENYAHRRLQGGGNFHVRQLGEAEGVALQSITLQEQPSMHIFSKLEEVKEQEDGVYCMPRVHNFPAIDAIMKPDYLFQMTISQKSHMNVNGLRKASGQLGGTKRLFFVVPDSMFASYLPVPNVPHDIQQYVLKVPWK